ncbi:MAG: mechanosensitive ion channel family protein [Candidatus Omnitrophica bacterium]|nr:mechanosensitive ion channel family protein [Candidatus Omnitrophota bacterium]
MDQISGFSLQEHLNMLMPLGIFLLTLFLGLIVRKIIFVRLAHWAKKTITPIDDIIVEALRGPSIIWSLMLGLYFALQTTAIPAGVVRIIDRSLLILAIFSVTFVLASMASNLINAYSRKLESTLPVTSLTQHISSIIIFAIGILIILNALGISITPILATLGIGGLAVALALQDTLSNLFAGFHIILTRQIRVGDYLKLDSGEEGYVTDINWRTTKIRMLPNNIVLVPNEKLSKSIVTNFCLPEKDMAVLVNLGVHYDSDLKKVEKVTCKVAKEVMKEVKGGVPEFDPFIRYHTFDDFSINFTVILRAKEFVDQYLVKHEFVKRLHEEYAKESINIPYPIRAINYGQEKEGSKP